MGVALCSVECPVVSDLKFLMLFEQGVLRFTFHWDPQMVWLVLCERKRENATRYSVN